MKNGKMRKGNEVSGRRGSDSGGIAVRRWRRDDVPDDSGPRWAASAGSAGSRWHWQLDVAN